MHPSAKRIRDYYKKMAKRKNEKLGMPQGTARNRLINNIVLSFFDLRDGLECFRCGDHIDYEEESWNIDHVLPWGMSEDLDREPLDLYLDVDNVVLSHASCNAIHGWWSRHQKLGTDSGGDAITRSEIWRYKILKENPVSRPDSSAKDSESD